MADNEKSHESKRVTKTDVARRQTSAAVRMFFKRQDPVVTHPIIVAGHQILTDFGAKSRMDAANFFEHADQDRKGRINIEPLGEVNAELLMDVIVMLHQLSVEIPMDMKIFCSWFVTKHPDLFDISTERMPRLNESDVDADDFDQISALITFYDITEEEHRRDDPAATNEIDD